MTKGKELLRGVGASKGEIVATVRVVDDDKEKKAKIAPGEIMVTDRTTPDDIVYMKKAAAFITNTGGKLSHTAIIARELGLPAVTGTVEATSVLKDGQKVVVDGDQGIVYEYVPGDEVEEKPKPKPAAGPSLAEKMATVAAKRGIKLPPGFTEKQKEKE